MQPRMHESWVAVLGDELEQPYMAELRSFLVSEVAAGRRFYPPADRVFNALALTPFDDVRVRRALNLAVDRNAAVDAFGGPGTAVPACQMLPPGISGYVRYCPYTRDPSASGRWKGPDLQRARRLVAGTRHRGMLVTYWVFTRSLRFF